MPSSSGRSGTTTAKPTRFRPGYRGWLAFCRTLGEDVAPFQRRIARAHFGPDREVVAVLPRGNAKSTTAALIGVHHVLSVPSPSVFVGAGSREQARVIGRIVERLARHSALRDAGLQVRHDELRVGLRETALQIIPADGSRAHGWERPTLIVGDEIWCWSDREPTLFGAMMTSMVKNPTCRFLGISTAAANLNTPLGRLRARAMAQEVTRNGALIDAHGGGLRWLEWSLPEDASPDDARAVKAANPAPWISSAELQQQRQRVTEIEYLQFHACRFGVGEGAWLPPHAWTACRGDTDADSAEPIFLGIDVGGSRAASAVVGVTADLRVVEIHVFQGDEAVLKVAETVEAIAQRRTVREAAFDPWRFQGEALRLERHHGLTMVAFPQSHSRMVVASERLHAAIVERRLTHPGHPELDRHVADAVAKQTGRGWRLDPAGRGVQIDAAVALAMAVDRAGQPAQPAARLLGFV